MIENGMVDYKEKEDKKHYYPICGEECESFYKDAWGNILGCEECVEKVDAWEVDDE